jgi:transcriptional regulator with XRE-family HTH domain
LNNLDEIFSHRLRSILEERGISQRQLARDMGVSTTTAQRWCQGKSPTTSNVIELSTFFGVTPQWFFGAENTPPMRDSLILEGISLLQKIEDIENLEKLVRILRIGLETQEDLKKKRKNKA